MRYQLYQGDESFNQRSIKKKKSASATFSPTDRTPKRERDIADHSSLKPQTFLRKLVYAALPLGEGVVCDPFMGSGSTLAAAEAVGARAVGVERRIDVAKEIQQILHGVRYVLPFQSVR